MKILLIWAVLFTALFGTQIQSPKMKYLSSGAVVDMVVEGGRLYSATDAGSMDIFDLKTAELIKKITVTQIKDFMGDTIDSKVYSVDALGNSILLVSQGSKGFRRIHVYQDMALIPLISEEDQLYIAKARYLNQKTLLIALLGNQIISYDIEERKQNWIVSVSQSKFSDFRLNEEKTEVAVADESGDLKIYHTNDGSYIKTLSGQNLDNVFQADYKNGIIATAGQDRRVVVYDTVSGSAYYKSSSFLIYSVGLSPSGKRVGFASDENNNVTVFDRMSKKMIGLFGGNKMSLNNILFLDENRFLVSSDDRTINLYQIK